MQKTLKNLTMSIAYDSDKDDILNDFYIPALALSSNYKRIAGYFSSSAFALAARGLAKFITNGGHMQLIINHILQIEDKNALEEIAQNPTKLDSILLHQMDAWDLENKIIRDHVGALGWMLVNNLLELKIAISNEASVFHQKVGILEDFENNKISFSGSNNESSSGWKSNIEEFKVFRNWVPEQNKYVETDVSKFSSFWNNLSKRVVVLDMPNAIRKKIIEIAPKKLEDIRVDIGLINHNFIYTPTDFISSERKIELMDFQKEAVKSWAQNNYKGILEMATGTGKTLAALGCLNQAMNRRPRLLCVISVPYNHLITQWKSEINKIIKNGKKKDFKYLIDLTTENFVTIGSASYNWKIKLSNKLLDLENGLIDKLIVFTTHDSSASNFFIDKISINSNDTILIADEVHGLGSLVRRKGLLKSYNTRLGLSATPERWMDEQGSRLIFDYFDKTVFEFPLEKAIKTINPLTGKTYLTPYDYMPYFTKLTDDEAYKYITLTIKIGKLFKYKDKSDSYQRRFEALIQERANIIKSASNKLIIFRDIIKDIQGKYEFFRDILVYCHQGNQLELVQSELSKMSIRYHKFTGSEGKASEKRYGGISERDDILKNFKEGLYQVLTSMKCLDEGVDIPSAKIAVIMASSTNPREFIQRRGRILRYFEGKDKSYIFDIIVMAPKLPDVDINMKKYEKDIYNREMARYKEFAKTADNAPLCLLRLIEAEKEYKIYD